ncbi:glycosyltransferase family 4 protein [Xylanibacter rodentium]|jgi:glycosyltransferase involved in cell wall biosynthesis|nr:glycosyltransferase family 4 protein [Xylanibacter rodentium]
MKIVRTSTVPGSLNNFCRNLLHELQESEGYSVVAVSSPGDALSEIASREGVKVYPVPMERHIAPVKDLISLWKLIKVFRKERPDMVHSITPKAGLLSMMAAWVCRVPVRLHTFTGLVFPTSTGFKQKLLIFTDRLTCSCATHIMPEGEGVKNDLINYQITSKPLKVLGYGNIRGIDLKYFDRTAEVEKETEKIRKTDITTFIFIGRLVRDKGINELVGAFAKLNKEYTKTRLLLVGRREDKLDPLEGQTLQEIENNPAIITTGEQKDVRPWLAASDIFVFPSYREGFPNVVIEAGAMGLPAIVTDINGSREIIIEGENGIIIPARDSEHLYTAMKQLMASPKQTRQMANNARTMIESRFEQTFVRKCLKKYYKEILQDV